MSVELRPLGVLCNIKCSYCYQNPLREARNVSGRYDIEAMKAAVLKEGGPFMLFGGEPLLMPLVDLESLFAWGFERFGQSGIQTNGVLLTELHVALFKRYKVGVGVSIDGPGELNDVRWAGNLQRTRESTDRTCGAIRILVQNRIIPTVIVTLHRGNATAERLPQLKSWFSELDDIGIQYVRLHLLEVDSRDVRARFALTTAENLRALASIAGIRSHLKRLRFDVFSEIERLLVGDDGDASCVWRACDPLTTPAVRGVEGNGQRSNCSRTNKEGIDFVKANHSSYERYIALYQTPYDNGGCRGCRFFLQCKGQCPGTAIDGDWRNRTEHCEIWMEMFSRSEQALTDAGITPLSLDKRRPQIEDKMIRAWTNRRNPTVRSLLGTQNCSDDTP